PRRFCRHPMILEPFPDIYWTTNQENNSHPRFGGLFNDGDDVLNSDMRVEWNQDLAFHKTFPPCVSLLFVSMALFQFQLLSGKSSHGRLPSCNSGVSPTAARIDVRRVLDLLGPVHLNSTQSHRCCFVLSRGCKGPRHCGNARSTFSALRRHHGAYKNRMDTRIGT